MKKLQYTIFTLCALFLFSACDFEEYQDDPNRITEATPELILTNLIVNSFNIVDVTPMLTSRMLVYTDGLDLNQYYGWTRSDFTAYGNLRQVYKLKEEAERLDQPQYIALGSFFSAYHFYNLTMTFGDIPYSEALQGFESNYTPVYDGQEAIFAGILQELEAANNGLAAAETEISGDVLFGGDVIKWRKAINSFRLRILMALSEKESASSINIKEQFERIVTNPSTYPLMESNMDDLALPYYDVAGNRYPYFENQNLTAAYLMEQTFVNFMKDNADPRLFAIGSITEEAQSNGLQPDDFAAYGGLDGSVTFDELNVQRAAGIGSLVNERYYTDPTVEPGVIMSYAELQFILAEAVSLGWISGNASDFYTNGIQANMEFYNVPQEQIDTYLATAFALYNPSKAKEKINTQKYLTYFFTGGWESYYNQRRTGVPVFSVGEGTLNGDSVPKRWMYPESESNTNQTNLENALDRQYGGNDNINGLMWLLK